MNALPMRVGIVVPTLGTRQDWLSDAVASVERQGDGVDLVIVAPPDAVSQVRAQLPGRRVLGEAQRGIVPAIEAGWAALEDCDVVSWLGDDDQLAPNSVSTALRFLLSHRGAEMVYGDYEYVNGSGRRIVAVRPGRSAPLWLRIGQNFIAQPGCLYRREAIARKGGLSRRFKLAFDAALHLDLARDAVYCPFTLSKVRLHDSRLTTAERDASVAELQDAVWGRGRHPFLMQLLRRCEPVWRLGGRFYYHFRRSY
jgi:hypothetical protein